MKKNIYLMYAISLLQGMVFYAPVATLYRQVHGISVFQITEIESISLALCLLLEIPWGILADRIGYRTTMIFCSILYFFSKIIFWRAETFGAFLLERILLSVILAGVSGVDYSILYLSSHAEESQKTIGIYNSMGMAGLLFSALVFTIFIQDDYQKAGLFTVISYGVAALLSFYLVEVKSIAPSEKKESKIVHRSFSRHMLFFLLAVAFLSETHQTITVFLNQLQYRRCGMEETEIGLLYLIATLLGTCGILSSKLVRKLGIQKSALILAIGAMVACLVLACTNFWLFSASGVLLLRMVDTLFQPLQAEVQNKNIQSKDRATVLSTNAMLIHCTAVVTNLCFGFLSEQNLSLAFFFGAGLCMLGFVFLFFSLRKLGAFSKATD